MTTWSFWKDAMAKKVRIALTKLEGEVMRIVWEAEPDPVRVRDVADALNGRPAAKPLAYNTVQTMLTILKDKGIVKLVDGPGRGHHYRARVSHTRASRHMVGELVDRLFDGRVQPLLHQLIDEGDFAPEELEQLRRWVDERLRDAEDKA